MAVDIKDYGLIGDLGTAALINSEGSLAWMCWPDFDSESCFASLLGTKANGVWMLAPKSGRTISRHYIPGTLVLDTTFVQTFGGRVTVTDFMPVRNGHSCLVRIVKGVQGRTRMRTYFAPRFDYGNAQPRLEKKKDGSWTAVTGPHRLVLRSNVRLEIQGGDLAADWSVKAGETYVFTLQHAKSYGESDPPPIDAEQALHDTSAYWTDWISQNRYHGPYTWIRRILTP